MASLLYTMKAERVIRIQDRKFQEKFYKEELIQQDEYSITLKKAEVAAAAKLACAYLGLHIKIKFDRDISMDEILKFEEELTHI
ncbi:hypothetical protein LCGC14_0882400 [marine sediment metagenome]|uniref:Uncharacterized protein n=1 Tax=marine sediment metagenome TaxID=412755 RepID=A0A0F9RL06_9ZZZZ